jgi:hypothetical protein
MNAHEYVVAAAAQSRPQQNIARAQLLAEATELSSFLSGLGQRCDAGMQEALRTFVQSQGDDGRELARCLGPECARPLWQLGLLGLLANKGLIMLSTEDDCDAQLIELSEPLPKPVVPDAALAAPDGLRGDNDARSPYIDADFESELEALELAAGTDGV